jgi:hypothetical protein
MIFAISRYKDSCAVYFPAINAEIPAHIGYTHPALPSSSFEESA